MLHTAKTTSIFFLICGLPSTLPSCFVFTLGIIRWGLIPIYVILSGVVAPRKKVWRKRKYKIKMKTPSLTKTRKTGKRNSQKIFLPWINYLSHQSKYGSGGIGYKMLCPQKWILGSTRSNKKKCGRSVDHYEKSSSNLKLALLNTYT